MPRIRTIKPEFPQSESMGRVSRDARLLFVMLWTICDDEGRSRAASRMLASLLFPYDDDAPKLIDGWLTELEAEGCIVRFEVEGSTYLQIDKWLKHQKIDKPSPSRLPAISEASRKVANIREPSTTDLVPSILDQDLGTSSLRSDVAPAPKRKTRASMPEGFPFQADLDWSIDYWLKKGRADLCSTIGEEVERFHDHHNGKLTSSADWSGSWRTWARNAIKFNNGAHNGRRGQKLPTAHDNLIAGAVDLIADIRAKTNGHS